MTDESKLARTVATAILGMDTLWGGDVMSRSGTGRLRRRSGSSGEKPESGSSSGKPTENLETWMPREVAEATDSTLARRSDGGSPRRRWPPNLP